MGTLPTDRTAVEPLLHVFMATMVSSVAGSAPDLTARAIGNFSEDLSGARNRADSSRSGCGTERLKACHHTSAGSPRSIQSCKAGSRPERSAQRNRKKDNNRLSLSSHTCWLPHQGEQAGEEIARELGGLRFASRDQMNRRSVRAGAGGQCLRPAVGEPVARLPAASTYR